MRYTVDEKSRFFDKGLYNKGPQGYGDPDDRSLAEAELKVAIPALEKRLIITERCAREFMEYSRCSENKWFYERLYSCSELKSKMNGCIDIWKSNGYFHEQAVEEYLNERKITRNTGVLPQGIDKYIADWLKKKKLLGDDEQKNSQET